jgi:hypothetical protein
MRSFKDAVSAAEFIIASNETKVETLYYKGAVE